VLPRTFRAVLSEAEQAQHVSREAGKQLASAGLTGPFLRDRARSGPAIPIRDAHGALHSWFVPVLVEDQLAGFFRVDPDGRHWSWSSFQRRPDTLGGCPAANLWFDLDAIRQRALSLAQANEVAQTPQLSFDRIPDRLAWRVRLQAPSGEWRDVFVAGSAVWPASSEEINSYE
jgi:hypothetical protein